MPRPRYCRRIAGMPHCRLFKPAGIPGRKLEEIVMTCDEYESLRLADYEGLYQEEAARRMNISRPTFGRIVEEARKKAAQALIEGKILRIEGGVIEMAEQRTFECSDCGHSWQVPFGTGRPAQCPACQSRNFCRAESERGGQGGGQGRNQHGCRRAGVGGQGNRGSGQGGQA